MTCTLAGDRENTVDAARDAAGGDDPAHHRPHTGRGPLGCALASVLAASVKMHSTAQRYTVNTRSRQTTSLCAHAGHSNESSDPRRGPSQSEVTHESFTRTPHVVQSAASSECSSPTATCATASPSPRRCCSSSSPASCSAQRCPSRWSGPASTPPTPAAASRSAAKVLPMTRRDRAGP